VIDAHDDRTVRALLVGILHARQRGGWLLMGQLSS